MLASFPTSLRALLCAAPLAGCGGADLPMPAAMRARRVRLRSCPILSDEAGDTRVRAYNERIVALVTHTKEAGHAIQLVDMHGALGAGDFADNLHPNDAGFAKMAQVWLDALTTAP